MYKIKIEMEMFKASVDIVFHDGPVLPDLSPHGYDGFDGNYGARCSFKSEGDGTPFVHKAVIHIQKPYVSMLAHEAVHASSFILEAMGVVADFNNDEGQAYMVEYIMSRCEDEWDKIINSYGDIDGVLVAKPVKGASKSGGGSNVRGQKPGRKPKHSG